MSTQRAHKLGKALEKMDHGTQHKLVLIVAPHGAGKARLIERWVQHWSKSSLFPPIWFFVDVEDNQPIQFLKKLISELTIWDPHIEDYVNIQVTDDQLLSGNGLSESRLITDIQQNIEPLLDAIINKLMLIKDDRFLILLNYHLIDDPITHELVAYLIDYLPPNFHLIISSQENPPLQIPRLRARRELLEIGLKEMQ
jgi:LuxR family maltose regulon positive regulatory protein